VLGFSDVMFAWDTSLYVLVLALVVSCLLVVVREPSARRFAAWGALVGASLLLDPAHMAAIAAAVAFLVAMRRVSFTNAAIAGGVAALVVVPWVMRNTIALGRPTGIRSNLGYEIYHGMYPEPDDGAVANRLNPGRNTSEFARYSAMGEGAYMADAAARGWALIVGDPRRAARRAVRRAIDYWAGSAEVARNPWPVGTLVRHALFALLGIGGCLGLLVLLTHPRIDETATAVLGAFIVVFPLPYYLTFSSLRYRAPLEPLFAVLTVAAVVTVVDRVRANARRIQRPPSESISVVFGTSGGGNRAR
jgi:hypothetical protein